MERLERWELLYIKWQGLSTLWIPDLCYDVSGIGVGMVPLCATTNQLLLRIIPLLLSLLVHDWNFISNDWCLKANSEFLRLCLHCSWRFTVSPLHFSQYVPHWHVPCGPQKLIVPSFLVYQARRFLSHSPGVGLLSLSLSSISFLFTFSFSLPSLSLLSICSSLPPSPPPSLPFPPSLPPSLPSSLPPSLPQLLLVVFMPLPGHANLSCPSPGSIHWLCRIQSEATLWWNRPGTPYPRLQNKWATKW